VRESAEKLLVSSEIERDNESGKKIQGILREKMRYEKDAR